MAEPNKQESNVSPSGNDSDQDFDPTAEMLVNEFDDEHTMDEEEALEDDDHSNELDDLTEEQNIPIEELLARYGYNNLAEPPGSSTKDSETNSDANNQAKSASSSTTANQSQQASNSQQGPLTNLSDSSDDDSDEDFSVNEDEWRRVIQVGSDFQAVIPDGLKHYDQSNDPSFNDKFLWKPSPMLTVSKIDDYLLEYVKTTLPDDDNLADFELPSGLHIKDDEQALYTLVHCKYDIKAALKQHEKGQEPKVPISEQMTPWTEEECRNFESGLRAYGKDFFQIKYSRIPSRTVGEVISFYYLWKKTERHDIFANKYRMEKKKYSLHPGTTDYMDRFLDEQEYGTMNMAPQQQQLQQTTNSITITPTNSTTASSSPQQPHQSNSSNHHQNQHQQQQNNRQSLINSSHRSSLNNQTSYNSNNLLSSMSNNRTIVNVSATDKPQTILISDSDFVCTSSEKPVVVCSGASGSQSNVSLNSKSNYYHKSSPSMLNFNSGSSSSNTTTIVVGKNPVLIDGNWMSSSASSSTLATSSNSGTSSSSSSQGNSMLQPSVSIFKVNPTNHHHSSFHR